jgi:hypothetical protein
VDRMRRREVLIAGDVGWALVLGSVPVACGCTYSRCLSSTPSFARRRVHGVLRCGLPELCGSWYGGRCRWAVL